MHSLIDSRALFRFTLAGALALTAAACSRSDRADAGRDTAQTASGGSSESQDAGPADTAGSATDSAPNEATRPAPATAPEQENVSGYRPMGQDTTPGSEASAPSRDTNPVTSPEPVAADTATAESDTVVAVGDSANVGKPGERLEENQSEQANADSLAEQTETERVRPPEDSTETVGFVTDTTGVGTSGDTAAGAAEMARDTTTVLAQGDTVAQQSAVRVESADSQAIQVQVDTASTEASAEVAQETATDTAAVVGDSTEIGRTGERLEANATTAEANADTLATETERVRPPEDSTELQGSATETADAQTGNAEVPAETDSIEPGADTVSVAAAEVPSTGKIATGAEAVALMSREGRRCMVVDEDQSQDLASSPATMNPCGTGTMTMPRVQAER